MTPTLNWFRSSYSSNDGPECVEAALSLTGAAMHIRDSKDTSRPHLTFTGVSWAAFVHTVATADRPA
ncbi:DUF397 domain-containing protein [Streptomyces sp. NPDC056568]|uniref:DUF397 domain-containing protein n=1 Tax=Streptomyces sp. NPDC056568 TaxID=3345866 RepID=UPI0036A14698